MRKPEQLSADEVAFRISRECHNAGVAAITQWPWAVSDGRYGNLSSLTCDAYVDRDYGSGELFPVKCGHEFSGRTIVEIGEEIIHHLCNTEHRSPPYQPYQQPSKKFSITGQKTPAPIPSPPAEPQPAGKNKHICLYCGVEILEGEMEQLVTYRRMPATGGMRRYRHTDQAECQAATRRPKRPFARVPGGPTQ